MANALTPYQALSIADNVYATKDDWASARSAWKSNDLQPPNAFTARTGDWLPGSMPLRVGSSSGFGYVAYGTEALEGHTIVACRGSAMLDDWATNGNSGSVPGLRGLPVHRGFQRTFMSCKEELSKLVDVHGRRPKHIHCVGHSLGGAVAGLAADHLRSQGRSKVSLYTFGTPRVGESEFSRKFEEELGRENIYRVFHEADAVPMVAPYPSVHAPTRSDYGLDWAGGQVSLYAHTRANYFRSVDPGDTWSSISSRNVGWSAAKQARYQRQMLGSTVHGAIMGSTWLLGLIQRALVSILQKGTYIGLTVSGGHVAAALLRDMPGNPTVLDQILWLLRTGTTHVAKAGAGPVDWVIRKIFQFLGRPLPAGVSITAAFLRWVADLMWSSLRTIAVRAVWAANALPA